MGDTTGMLEAAQTGCELLHVIDRDDLNGHFLPIILGEARLLGETKLAAYGYLALARNIRATGNPICIDVLLEGREWLARSDEQAAQEALAFARSAPVVLARIAGRATVKLRAVPVPVSESWAPELS